MDAIVVMSRAVPPPAVCFKCGTDGGLALVACKFRTSPKDLPALDVAQAAGLVVGWLGPAVDLFEAARVAHQTREATVGIPLCPVCAPAWKKARTAETIAGFGPFIVVAVMCIGIALSPGVVLGGGIAKYVFIGVVALLVYIAKEVVPGLVDTRMVRLFTCSAVAIDDATIGLSRVHPRAGEAVSVAAQRNAGPHSTTSAPLSRPPSTPSSFL